VATSLGPRTQHQPPSCSIFGLSAATKVLFIIAKTFLKFFFYFFFFYFFINIFLKFLDYFDVLDVKNNF
jgi:hypothetical protein